MNEEQEKLLRMLDRATASEPGGDEPMDPQTADLQQAWRALGRLLESSQPADPPMVRFPAAPALRRRRLARPVVLAAIAAAIAIAVTLVLLSGNRQPAGELAKTPQPAPAGIAKATPVKPAMGKSNGSTGELAWDDRLDEQIAQVGRRVKGAQGEWSLYGSDYAAVRSGLRAIEQEIEGNKL